MKRWNWWLAYRVLRGRVHMVSYESRDERLTVELDADRDARRHKDALHPGRF